MGKVALHTLGCKLNFAETATIARQFAQRGFEIVDFGTPADVVVLNTCTVTEKADRECRQLVRRALRRSPEAFVVVTGCYAQLQPELVGSMEGVDLVLGSKEKLRIFDYTAFVKGPRAAIHAAPIRESVKTSIADSSGFDDRTRAFLKIQDGCDYHCSFCTIPLARGGSRSASIPEVLERAREIARQGYKEIVLTGVNVGDYAADGEKLIGLLRSLESVEGLDRIRISSIEPNLLDDDLLGYWTESVKICNHFHIPLQSGSDSVLRGMRRRYTTDWYTGRIAAIKAAAPDAGIGADVIVGFPGETDSLFEEGYQFLVEQPLSYLHVFSYSERGNTAAVRFDAKVDPRLRSERSERLRILSEKKREAFHGTFKGKEVSVLFEAPLPDGTQRGLTGEYARVHVPSPRSLENEIVSVIVNEIREGHCLGNVMNETEGIQVAVRRGSLVA